MKIKMSWILVLVSFILFSSNAFAVRAWIGATKVKQINFVKSSGNCAPTNGACMLLTFEEGYKGCEVIAIRESDVHFKHIESMAYISFSSGKKFKVYASNDHCNNADSIAINNAELYE
ncbi:MAG: hypothetical protein K6L76_02510 [Agarilytica sp.]